MFSILILYWSGFGIFKQNQENPDKIGVVGQSVSYTTLVGAKASKLGSCDKHQESARTRMLKWACIGANDRNVMVNFEPGECTREMFFSVSDTGCLKKKKLTTPKRIWAYNIVVTSLDSLISTHLIHNNKEVAYEEVMICLNNKDRSFFTATQ